MNRNRCAPSFVNHKLHACCLVDAIGNAAHLSILNPISETRLGIDDNSSVHFVAAEMKISGRPAMFTHAQRAYVCERKCTQIADGNGASAERGSGSLVYAKPTRNAYTFYNMQITITTNEKKKRRKIQTCSIKRIFSILL